MLSVVHHRLLISFFAVNAFSMLIVTRSFSAPSSSTKNKCVIKICHNKDCTKQGGGEALLNTFRDLLPAASDSSQGAPNDATLGLSVERSGCLSQCGRGPNISVVVDNNDANEKTYFGVDDPTTASAVLEVATGEEYPINLLVAASSIYDAEQATSASKKESLLSSAISTVTKDGDPTLLNSFAHAHALLLRADARLDLSPPDVNGAIDDAKSASRMCPTERKAWRVLASAQEAAGNLNDAMDAVGELAKVDPSFSTKAKREMERLASLACVNDALSEIETPSLTKSVLG